LPTSTASLATYAKWFARAGKFSGGGAQWRFGYAPTPGGDVQCQRKSRAWVDAQCTPSSSQMLFPETDAHTGAQADRRKDIRQGDRLRERAVDRAMANARVKGWRIYEVPCGHDVMLDMPERLATILQEAL
jgi:hypothetical protein